MQRSRPRTRQQRKRISFARPSAKRVRSPSAVARVRRCASPLRSWNNFPLSLPRTTCRPEIPTATPSHLGNTGRHHRAPAARGRFAPPNISLAQCPLPPRGSRDWLGEAGFFSRQHARDVVERAGVRNSLRQDVAAARAEFVRTRGSVRARIDRRCLRP